MSCMPTESYCFLTSFPSQLLLQFKCLPEMLSAHMQTNSIMWKESFIDNKTNCLFDHLCDCLLVKTRHSFRSAIDSSALLVISLSCSSSRPDTIAICFLTSSSISNFSSDFETVVLKKKKTGLRNSTCCVGIIFPRHPWKDLGSYRAQIPGAPRWRFRVFEEAFLPALLVPTHFQHLLQESV